MGVRHEQGQGERAPASASVRFPDFVCVGAQKAGTTWLHDNLAAHPAIWLPPVKELHYFDQLYVDTPGHQQAADERRRKKAERALAASVAELTEAERHAATLIATGAVSDDWYGSIFALAPSTSVCGEITGSYALLPAEGVDHLLRLAPDVKIIFLVRDPIERAWSHVQMLHRRGSPHAQQQFKPLPTLELDPRVLSRSRYSDTLRTYRSRLDDGSIWVGDFDQLTNDPPTLLRAVCSFLGVEFDEGFFPSMRAPVHTGTPRELDPKAYERLKAALEPEYDELALILPDAAVRWRSRHYG